MAYGILFGIGIAVLTITFLKYCRSRYYRLDEKQALVHFFDGMTGLMQMLFFLSELLSFPSQLPKVAAIGLLVALFLTFIARPKMLSCMRLSLKQVMNGGKR